MATLSAASRRGGGGGGGEPTDGNGTRCILQKLKMASLREEDSIGESPTEGQKMTITETTKSGSGHKACDDRSDSGFSECPSVASPTAMLVRPTECPSPVSEETPLVFNRDRSPPPPTRRSTPPITDRSSSPATIRPYFPPSIRSSSPTTIRHSSPTTIRSSSPATKRPSSPATIRRSSPATIRPSSPATIRPSSPATMRRSSPATIRPSSPDTRRAFSPVTTRCPLSPKIGRSSSPATHSSSSPATRGPSSLTTHPRSPLLRNRHDSTHPVHDVPLPTGTGVSNLCKTNRMIFDGERHDGSKSSAGMSSSGGVQRKEPIRIQTADNFKKAVAFWKQ